MKEIPQRDLPMISGGEQNPNGSTPLPGPGGPPEYPRNPFGPIYEEPVNFED